MTSTQTHPGFWVLCERYEEISDPLTVFLPDLGEALAVFNFAEEALLYALLSNGGGDRRATLMDVAGLSALLSGPWSRFEWVALDPLPNPGLLNRPASMDREAFLTLLAPRDGGTGEPECLAVGGFTGYELCDPLGRRIGRVSRVFVDGGGSLAHVEVALGFLTWRTVLVPVEGCEVDEARQTLVLKRGRRA
jgi:hypothetical protein